MKIKQIRWADENTVQTGMWVTFYTELPLGHNALIKKTQNTYRWSIGLRTTVIVGGKTKTLAEAKQACQIAWEGLVGEALEMGERNK